MHSPIALIQPKPTAHKCQKCGGQARLLTSMSKVAWVNYIRCDSCGQVWTGDKQAATPQKRVFPRRDTLTSRA